MPWGGGFLFVLALETVQDSVSVWPKGLGLKDERACGEVGLVWLTRVQVRD